MGETDETKFPLLKLMMMRLKSTRRRFTRAIQKKNTTMRASLYLFSFATHAFTQFFIVSSSSYEYYY